MCVCVCVCVCVCGGGGGGGVFVEVWLHHGKYPIRVFPKAQPKGKNNKRVVLLFTCDQLKLTLH